MKSHEINSFGCIIINKCGFNVEENNYDHHFRNDRIPNGGIWSLLVEMLASYRKSIYLIHNAAEKSLNVEICTHICQDLKVIYQF